MTVWRAEDTGAAVGYCDINGHAICIGNPLCHVSQYTKTIGTFLRYIRKERHLKPVWVLAGHECEEALAEKYDWRTFSVANEQRLDPSRNSAAHDSE